MKYFAVIIFTLVLAGCHNNTAPVVQQNSGTGVIQSSTGTIADGLSIVDKTITDNYPTYTINAVVPQVQGLKDANALSDINAQLTQIVHDQIGFFSQDSSGITVSDLASNQEQPYSLDVSYKPVFLNNRIVSILLDVWTYTGGAHGNSITVAFNYDVADKHLLHLKDLFQPQSNYLQELSALTIPKVADYLEEQSGIGSVDMRWISDGASPDPDNFQSFNMTDQGIQFTFDPYQVAAFAYGESQVTIKYSEMRGILSDRIKTLFLP